MYEWHRQIQAVVDAIDVGLAAGDSEAVTLDALAALLGYSPYHMTRKFHQMAGMTLKEYRRLRRLAFALIEVRDTRRSLLDIATEHGFSSHEAFTRAFRSTYGLTPTSYRNHPVPVVLRTKIRTFDRYILGMGEIGMVYSSDEIKIYYATMPAHRYLHIKNYDSQGYFDFWQRQAAVPGQDCDTICGLLDSVRGKLDGDDSVIGQFSGQSMAHLHEADGSVAEAYGVRLPAMWSGLIPQGMLLIDVPEAEYVVFEHGPFDYEQESETVGRDLDAAIDAWSFEGSGYAADESAGRVEYFFFDPSSFEKRVRPVRRLSQ